MNFTADALDRDGFQRFSEQPGYVLEDFRKMLAGYGLTITAAQIGDDLFYKVTQMGSRFNLFYTDSSSYSNIGRLRLAFVPAPVNIERLRLLVSGNEPIDVDRLRVAVHADYTLEKEGLERLLTDECVGLDLTPCVIKRGHNFHLVLGTINREFAMEVIEHLKPQVVALLESLGHTYDDSIPNPDQPQA